MTSTTIDCAEVMAELEAAGTAQNRKIYTKHGAIEPMFGVSYAEIGKLQKRIKTNHSLAMELWATGNHDAQIVACRIADASAISVADANEMVKACANYVVAEAVAALLADSKIADARAKAWRDKKDEWAASAGWAITASLALKERMDTDLGLALLDQIELEIADRPNRVRHEMNQCLITFGLLPALHDRALEVAAAVSPVDVDHGDTSCKTPDAAGYITKTLAHREKQAIKKAEREAAKAAKKATK